MIKKCPRCKNDIIFKHPISFKKALKDNSVCRKCKAKERSERPEEKKRLLEIAGSCKGEKNGMFNKTLYDVWLEKFGKEEADKRHKVWYDNVVSANNKEENTFKTKMSGLTTYDFWVKKFGKEEADKKNINFKKKQSINTSGENNPMYGKPSPRGSGNGWSGWYNGWFFRSLRELSYMIKEIELKDKIWENGEQKKYRVSYVDWNGVKRNYFSDFIVSGKYMIECKPLKLQNSVNKY